MALQNHVHFHHILILVLKDSTLRESLKSPLFKRLKETGMLLGEHDGGCLLFEKEEEVKELMR